MKNHTKIYFDYFGYDKNSFIECEICGAKAVDLHHIERRGMGGSKSADRIENIMALCRKHHEEFGDKKQWKEWLIKLHTIKMGK
jgi:hypothetical protein